MSFGALSKNAILALNAGAKGGNFYHNTGEGGLSPYHLQNGGDVVWNIGTGYFSCRTDDGKFSYDEYAKRAVLENVKMIEIKFSQGAKPGHGGILPKEKVTDEIAAIRLVSKGQDIVSPPTHSAFTTPLELMEFVKLLRKGSGGKPVGMKICIGNKSEFLSICKAMVATKTYLDFITVDGGEGGTGAAPPEYSDHVGMPLREALAFVYDTLNGFGIKDQIKIIASGKVISGFDIIKNLSIGADLCNSARGMMFALGCIQALECHANTCPTGVATQDAKLMKGLVPEDKSIRVTRYHNETVKSAVDLMASAGINHPDNVTRDAVSTRVERNKVETYAQIFPELEAGCLTNKTTVTNEFLYFWNKASEEKF
jgi:glutamate synthase domain-containing protein 2